MHRTIPLTTVAALLALAGAGARAESASVDIVDFSVDVRATDASLQPRPSVTFSGGDAADTEITSTPRYPDDPPGPPGFTIFSEGIVTSPSAFGEVLSLSDASGLGSSDADAYFAGMGDTGSAVGQVGTSDDTWAFPNFATLTLGGDSFTLSPYSQLVVTADLRFDASGDTASASLAFLGANQPSWAYATAQGSFEQVVTLVFTNDTGQAVDGRFAASFHAALVPEPSGAAMLAAALLAFGLVAGTRVRRSPCPPAPAPRPAGA